MTVKSRESNLDVGALLTIDVAAEVRKLGQAQLAGSWQVPGELAARAVRAGARSVAVAFDRRGFSVRDDGRPILPATLRALATVLDADAAADARHAALVSLEGSGELALVALAGSGAESISISSGTTLRWSRGGRAVVSEAGGAPPRGTFVEAAGASFDRAEARRWLFAAFRFLTAARLDVDGVAVSQGFAGAIASEPLRAPFAGTIALPREGDVARVWLLLDGVVATHVGVAGAPCFEAAVEARGLVGERGGAAEARDAIEPHLATLSAQAAALAARSARKMSSLSERDASRVRSALLLAAKGGSREAEDAPAFRSIAAGGVVRWLSLRDLEALASGGRPIAAIYPHLDPGRFVLPAASAPALVLDAADRSRVAALLGITFVSPPARPPSRSRFARAADALGAWLAGLLRSFSRPLPDAALTPAERALLDAMRARLALEIAFCAGRRAPRASRSGRLLLARENDVVRAAVAAVARDPRLAPIAAVALAPDAAV